MEAELEVLTGEEEQLAETMHGLKETFSQVSSDCGRKPEEIRKLTRKVEELQNGKKNNKKPRMLKEEDANTEQVTESNLTGRKDAVLIFPEEVWTMILGNVLDPKDIWNLTNTCQLFDNVLSSWKAGWMLGQALPYIYKDLSKEKLLECRVVCKSWSLVVDNFLDNHPSMQPYQGESDPRRIDFVCPVKEKGIDNRNVFNFGPNEDLSALEQLFPKERGRNPFIGRHVVFNFRIPHDRIIRKATLEEEEQRWAKMYGLLEAYGKEIWSLTIYFSFARVKNIRTKISELLTSKLFQLVPNLRRLCAVDPGLFGSILHNQGHLMAQNLQTLIVGDISFDPAVCTLIEKFHEQLEVLLVGESSWVEVNNIQWPNLKELMLYIGKLNDDDDIEDEDADITHFFQRTDTMPQLGKFTLNLEEDNLGFKLLRLVEAINMLTFSTSLKSFGLVGKFENLKFDDLDFTQIISHKVKTLELIDEINWSSTSLPCHNFLRYFPFIENLVIIIRKNASDYEKDAIIDLLPRGECKTFADGLEKVDEVVEVNKYLYDGKMYQSNIWELLPHLKVLTFQWDVYTRHEYEEYQQKLERNLASMPV